MDKENLFVNLRTLIANSSNSLELHDRKVIRLGHTIEAIVAHKMKQQAFEEQTVALSRNISNILRVNSVPSIYLCSNNDNVLKSVSLQPSNINDQQNMNVKSVSINTETEPSHIETNLLQTQGTNQSSFTKNNLRERVSIRLKQILNHPSTGGLTLSKRGLAFKKDKPKRAEAGKLKTKLFNKRSTKTHHVRVLIDSCSKKQDMIDLQKILKLFGQGEIVESALTTSSALIRLKDLRTCHDFIQRFNSYEIRGKPLRATLYG